MDLPEQRSPTAVYFLTWNEEWDHEFRRENVPAVSENGRSRGRGKCRTVEVKAIPRSQWDSCGHAAATVSCLGTGVGQVES